MVLTGVYLGNMHQIVTFWQLLELCTGFVVAPLESESLIVFYTPVSEKIAAFQYAILLYPKGLFLHSWTTPNTHSSCVLSAHIDRSFH